MHFSIPRNLINQKLMIGSFKVLLLGNLFPYSWSFSEKSRVDYSAALLFIIKYNHCKILPMIIRDQFDV